MFLDEGCSSVCLSSPFLPFRLSRSITFFRRFFIISPPLSLPLSLFFSGENAVYSSFSPTTPHPTRQPFWGVTPHPNHPNHPKSFRAVHRLAKERGKIFRGFEPRPPHPHPNGSLRRRRGEKSHAPCLPRYKRGFSGKNEI